MQNRGAPWPPSRTPMSPPSPRVAKACPGLACWTRFPLWEKGHQELQRRRRSEHRTPALPPGLPGPSRPDCTLGPARRPGRALSNVQGKSPSNSKQHDSCNIPGPAPWRGRAEPAARGGVRALPAGRGWDGSGGAASAALQLPQRALDVHAVAHACDAQLHEVFLSERGQVRALDLVVLEAVAVLA